MSEAQEVQTDAQVAPHQFSQDLGAIQDESVNRYVAARYGVDMVANQIKYNQKTPAMNIPEWVASISITVGALIITLRVIEATMVTLKQKVKINLEKGGK